ncbi:unnamed protein product [Mesocestoides corti]|uniref:Uncharacterized protein n=1 Tax=Mesocestoides corti TaxID=53468 RepID=A0A0R3UMP8_MESCO|nr:unnamed protein product [Mesocestoides corti]
MNRGVLGLQTHLRLLRFFRCWRVLRFGRGFSSKPSLSTLVEAQQGAVEPVDGGLEVIDGQLGDVVGLQGTTNQITDSLANDNGPSSTRPPISVEEV